MAQELEKLIKVIMKDQEKFIEVGAQNLETYRENTTQSNYEIVYGTDPRVNIDSLLAFEDVSWEPEEVASKESLEERLNSFPEGISMLYDVDPTDGEVKAMSQLTVAPKVIPQDIESFAQMRDLPVDRQSDVLWGTNLGRRQGEKYNGKGYATAIVKDRLFWAMQNGYKKFMAGLTCDGLKEAMEGYYKQRKDDLFEYVKIEENNPQLAALEYMQRSMNPTVNTFLRAAGELGLSVEVGDPIPGYWPENETSLGYAVMIIINTQKEAINNQNIPDNHEAELQFSFDLNEPLVLGKEMRETTSGRENTMFVYLPAKGCENNCAFCSIKHIKADKYTPSQEKSIDLSNSIRVFLKENRDVDTLKIFNGGNVLHGSEYGKSMEVHEYFWDKLVELIGDLQEMSGGSLNLSSIELEVRLDELVETDDPRKMVIQERVINLKDRLSELGIELRLILAYEYIDNKVIRSQGKFANIDNQEDRIREALGFLHSHNIPSLAYAMFGGRAGDRPMRSDEAIDAAVNTIKFGLSIENGPREVIVNCQYLDPLQQEDEKGKGKQLYVPQQEDFVTLVLKVSDLLKEADGKRVRISYAAEDIIVGTKGSLLDREFVELLDQFNSANDQAQFVAERFDEIVEYTS